MDDQEFLDRIRTKIERLAGKEIQLDIDEADEFRLTGEFAAPVPRMTMGSGVIKYPGFARMAVEFAVASIRQGRDIGLLEFHVLLQRN